MMSPCSRRTRGEGHKHHVQLHDDQDGAEPPPDTDTRVPPRNPKVTFTEATKPPRDPLDSINTVLHVPNSPYNIDQIHFVLWYSLTTTLSPDKIAELFNHFFKPPQPIARWAIADIVNAVETRWKDNGKKFGATFRLSRPRSYGTCPCDFPTFHIDCLDVKRTKKTRQNQKYLTLAASLWDQSAAQLVSCPRGRNSKDQPNGSTIATQDARPTSPLNTTTAFVLKVRHYIYPPARLAATLAFWLWILDLWFAGPSDTTLASPLQCAFSPYLHGQPPIVALATLHFLFETCLDGLPDFARLRTMPFGDFVWHALLQVLQTTIAIKVSLVLCVLLGGLPNITLVLFARRGLLHGRESDEVLF